MLDSLVAWGLWHHGGNFTYGRQEQGKRQEVASVPMPASRPTSSDLTSFHLDLPLNVLLPPSGRSRRPSFEYMGLGGILRIHNKQ